MKNALFRLVKLIKCNDIYIYIYFFLFLKTNAILYQMDYIFIISTIIVLFLKIYRLTGDEIVRKNYELYGHPDGKQSFSMGVALPRGLVEGGNSKFVLLFYAIAFGLGLPYYIVSIYYIFYFSLIIIINFFFLFFCF